MKGGDIANFAGPTDGLCELGNSKSVEDLLGEADPIAVALKQMYSEKLASLANASLLVDVQAVADRLVASDKLAREAINANLEPEMTLLDVIPVDQYSSLDGSLGDLGLAQLRPKMTLALRTTIWVNAAYPLTRKAETDLSEKDLDSVVTLREAWSQLNLFQDTNQGKLGGVGFGHTLSPDIFDAKALLEKIHRRHVELIEKMDGLAKSRTEAFIGELQRLLVLQSSTYHT